LLPNASVNASFSRSDDKKNSLNQDSDTYTFQVNIPIFQGGAEYANISRTRADSRKSDFIRKQTEREVNEGAINAWNAYRTAKALIKARKTGVDASQKALEGVDEEVKAGTRTTIDLLDAERDVFNAKVAYRNAQLQYIVSIFQMYQVMGTMPTPSPDYLENALEKKYNTSSYEE